MSDSSATPWTVARQAPVSMGFPRQEYRSGLPFPFLVNYTSKKKKKAEEKIKLCVWNFVFWPYVNGHSDTEKRFLGVIWWPKICAKSLKTTETHFMDTSSYRKGCFAILVMNLGAGNSWEFWENLCLEINQVQDSCRRTCFHRFITLYATTFGLTVETIELVELESGSLCPQSSHKRRISVVWLNGV